MLSLCWAHYIHTKPTRGRYNYYPSFTDEETEARRVTLLAQGLTAGKWQKAEHNSQPGRSPREHRTAGPPGLWAGATQQGLCKPSVIVSVLAARLTKEKGTGEKKKALKFILVIHVFKSKAASF